MKHPSNQPQTVIIGAGLSGLASALLALQAGQNVCVLEAGERRGGRIHSVYDDANGAYIADLGPTWIWPSFQPTIKRWVDTLGLATFPQFNEGQAILDYGPDTEPEHRFLPDQEGNVRLAGGPQALIDALIARLPSGTVRLNAPVRRVEATEAGAIVHYGDAATEPLACERVIVAVPPRIALSTIAWTPELPSAVIDALDRMPTWMAPHAKVVARYETAFWRARGLSGRIASQAGPIVEGHDHCGLDGSPATIFGFIGWPHGQRTQAGDALAKHIRDQLRRCFGPDSPEPLALQVEDWARNPHVAAPGDLDGPMHHPSVGPDILRKSHCHGRVWFAGAETAEKSPGLIEGAFDSAERAVRVAVRHTAEGTKAVS